MTATKKPTKKNEDLAKVFRDSVISENEEKHAEFDHMGLEEAKKVPSLSKKDFHPSPELVAFAAAEGYDVEYGYIPQRGRKTLDGEMQRWLTVVYNQMAAGTEEQRHETDRKLEEAEQRLASEGPKIEAEMQKLADRLHEITNAPKSLRKRKEQAEAALKTLEALAPAYIKQRAKAARFAILNGKDHAFVEEATQKMADLRREIEFKHRRIETANRDRREKIDPSESEEIKRLLEEYDQLDAKRAEAQQRYTAELAEVDAFEQQHYWQ